MRYDVIIIGGGFGGLICGRQLAKEGLSVLVLERQHQPGGCLQSYRRHGVTYDTGFHYVGGLGEGQSLHRLFSQLGLMDLPWHRLDPDGFDKVTIGQQTYAFPEGYDAFVEAMSDYFPQHRSALRAYVDMLQRVEQATGHTEQVMELMEINAYDYLINLFHDPLIVNVLSGTALKTELRRESLPLYSFAHTAGSYLQSSWRLRGDGNLIVNKLADDINTFGGTILCHSEVDELTEEDGRITTVHCTNGEQYESDFIISDVHPAVTFGWVKESQCLKRFFRYRLQQCENTFGVFTVSLRLKPDTLPYFNHNKFVYYKADVWTFYENTERIGGLMACCRLPEKGNYTTQIDLLTPISWQIFQPWENTQVGHRGEDYQQLKQRLADECIMLAERVIPDLHNMIIEQHTSSPLTYQNYTLTPNGSAYGIRKDCRSAMLTMLSPQSPIPNLLLTGQSLMLHGLEGVAMTAMSTIKTLHRQKDNR